MIDRHDPALPLIARLHEVRSNAELAEAEGFVAVAAPPARQARAQAAAQADRSAGGRLAPAQDADTDADERVLPFVGAVVRHVPDHTVTIERRLSLDEDLHLADHHFVHAHGVKPLAACFPVVPMTVSLEIMAEAAACLAPGYGLTGFENVMAARWIALADTDELTLRVEGRVRHDDPVREIRRVGVEIFVMGETRASISATVLFSSHYQLDLNLGFDAFVTDNCRTLAAARAYGERQLFHGPRFQCLVGDLLMGERGARAELQVRAPADLFRSTGAPQLLSDPSLLDTVGQAMALWTLQHGGVVFPVGLGKLEFYRATPEPGTRVPMHVEVTGNGSKTLTANVQIEDGNGGVWLRIKDWKSWRFQWDRKLVAFRQLPTRHLLSDTLHLPIRMGGDDTQTEEMLCQRMTRARLAGFDLDLLARHYLHLDEMPVFAAHAGQGMRQFQWLLGRVAAKDAVRAWDARRSHSDEALHPAVFAIENDAQGKPLVAHWPRPVAPELSIAHCGDEAIAVAWDAAVGIDLERIATRDAGFVRAMASETERALLAGVPESIRDEWITRLWCAKEALGKLMGTGVETTPHHFEVAALDLPSGVLRMRHRGSGREARVTTLRDGAFVIAVGFDEASGA